MSVCHRCQFRACRLLYTILPRGVPGRAGSPRREGTGAHHGHWPPISRPAANQGRRRRRQTLFTRTGYDRETRLLTTITQRGANQNGCTLPAEIKRRRPVHLHDFVIRRTMAGNGRTGASIPGRRGGRPLTAARIRHTIVPLTRYYFRPSKEVNSGADWPERAARPAGRAPAGRRAAPNYWAHLSADKERRPAIGQLQFLRGALPPGREPPHPGTAASGHSKLTVTDAPTAASVWLGAEAYDPIMD